VSVIRGAPWGDAGPLPADALFVATDAEAAAELDAARREGRDPRPVALLGGNLCRALGGRGDLARLHGGDATRATVDVLSVTIDGGAARAAVAHVVARGATWWFGPVTAAMNAEWLGEWDLAPRAHPGDGLVDVVRAELSFADRRKARRRLPSGTHVPHPGIRIDRSAAVVVETHRPQWVWLDGVRAGRARRIEIEVLPDALRVAV
jgi:hypothetical protein